MTELCPGQEYVHRHNPNIKRAEENWMAKQDFHKDADMVWPVPKPISEATSRDTKSVNYERGCYLIPHEKWVELNKLLASHQGAGGK